MFSDTRDEFAALDPPNELAAAHDSLVGAVDGVIGEIEKARASGINVGTFLAEASEALAEFRRSCAALGELAAVQGIDLLLSCEQG